MGRKKHKPSKIPPPAVAQSPIPASATAEASEFNWILAAVLFGVALLIRLIALGRADLWCDEILFIGRTHAPKSPFLVLSTNWRELLLVTHLPLPELVQNLFLWLCLPFDSDLIHNTWLLRLPAVFWGAGSVPLVYRLASRLFRQPTAFVAALTQCFFFYPVYYSREAYYYAPLIFFAAATLDLYVGRIGRQHASAVSTAAFVACLSGLVLSHLTGILFGAILFVVHLGALGYASFIRKDAESARRLGRMLPLFIVPVLLVAPYVLKLATNPIESGMSGAPMSFAGVLFYVLGKFTLGTVAPWPILGSIVLLAGALRMFKRGPKREARILLALVILSALLILVYSQIRTQFALRYFNVLWPGFVCIWAAGIEALVAAGIRLSKAPPILESGGVYAFGSLFILSHTLLFLPPMYQLHAKDRDFGGLSRWLTSNLRSGTPYFFEYGGWDLRFVPGYFPTPGLSHTVALAWNGPDFEQAKRKLQTNIMARFPESACVESLDVEWTDLQHRYRHKMELHNEPVMRLIRRGIWFETPLAHAPDRAPNDLNIWYNTMEDAVDLAREAGAPAYFAYDNTECAQMTENVYVHAAQGNKATIRVINLKGNPLRGTFRIEGAVNTKQETCPLFVSWQNQVVLQSSSTRGKPWTLDTPPVTLPPGEHMLTLTASERGDQPVLNVAVVQTEFRPAP